MSSDRPHRNGNRLPNVPMKEPWLSWGGGTSSQLQTRRGSAHRKWTAPPPNFGSSWSGADPRFHPCCVNPPYFQQQDVQPFSGQDFTSDAVWSVQSDAFCAIPRGSVRGRAGAHVVRGEPAGPSAAPFHRRNDQGSLPPKCWDDSHPSRMYNVRKEQARKAQKKANQVSGKKTTAGKSMPGKTTSSKTPLKRTIVGKMTKKTGQPAKSAEELKEESRQSAMKAKANKIKTLLKKAKSSASVAVLSDVLKTPDNKSSIATSGPRVIRNLFSDLEFSSKDWQAIGSGGLTDAADLVPGGDQSDSEPEIIETAAPRVEAPQVISIPDGCDDSDGDRSAGEADSDGERCSLACEWAASVDAERASACDNADAVKSVGTSASARDAAGSGAVPGRADAAAVREEPVLEKWRGRVPALPRLILHRVRLHRTLSQPAPEPTSVGVEAEPEREEQAHAVVPDNSREVRSPSVPAQARPVSTASVVSSSTWDDAAASASELPSSAAGPAQCPPPACAGAKRRRASATLSPADADPDPCGPAKRVRSSSECSPLAAGSPEPVAADQPLFRRLLRMDKESLRTLVDDPTSTRSKYMVARLMRTHRGQLARRMEQVRFSAGGSGGGAPARPPDDEQLSAEMLYNLRRMLETDGDRLAAAGAAERPGSLLSPPPAGLLTAARMTSRGLSSLRPAPTGVLTAARVTSRGLSSLRPAPTGVLTASRMASGGLSPLRPAPTGVLTASRVTSRGLSSACAARGARSPSVVSNLEPSAAGPVGPCAVQGPAFAEAAADGAGSAGAVGVEPTVTAGSSPSPLPAAASCDVSGVAPASDRLRFAALAGSVDRGGSGVSSSCGLVRSPPPVVTQRSGGSHGKTSLTAGEIFSLAGGQNAPPPNVHGIRNQPPPRKNNWQCRSCFSQSWTNTCRIFRRNVTLIDKDVEGLVSTLREREPAWDNLLKLSMIENTISNQVDDMEEQVDALQRQMRRLRAISRHLRHVRVKCMRSGWDVDAHDPRLPCDVQHLLKTMSSAWRLGGVTHTSEQRPEMPAGPAGREGLLDDGEAGDPSMQHGGGADGVLTDGEVGDPSMQRGDCTDGLRTDGEVSGPTPLVGAAGAAQSGDSGVCSGQGSAPTRQLATAQTPQCRGGGSQDTGQPPTAGEPVPIKVERADAAPPVLPSAGDLAQQNRVGASDGQVKTEPDGSASTTPYEEDEDEVRLASTLLRVRNESELNELAAALAPIGRSPHWRAEDEREPALQLGLLSEPEPEPEPGATSQPQLRSDEAPEAGQEPGAAPSMEYLCQISKGSDLYSSLLALTRGAAQGQVVLQMSEDGARVVPAAALDAADPADECRVSVAEMAAVKMETGEPDCPVDISGDGDGADGTRDAHQSLRMADVRSSPGGGGEHRESSAAAESDDAPEGDDAPADTDGLDDVSFVPLTRVLWDDLGVPVACVKLHGRRVYVLTSEMVVLRYPVPTQPARDSRRRPDLRVPLCADTTVLPRPRPTTMETRQLGGAVHVLVGDDAGHLHMLEDRLTAADGAAERQDRAARSVPVGGAVSALSSKGERLYIGGDSFFAIVNFARLVAMDRLPEADGRPTPLRFWPTDGALQVWCATAGHVVGISAFEQAAAGRLAQVALSVSGQRLQIRDGLDGELLETAGPRAAERPGLLVTRWGRAIYPVHAPPSHAAAANGVSVSLCAVDLESGRFCGRWRLVQPVTALAADAKHLYIGHQDGSLRVMRAVGQRPDAFSLLSLQQLRYAGAAPVRTISARGGKVATGSPSGVVEVLMETGAGTSVLTTDDSPRRRSTSGLTTDDSPRRRRTSGLTTDDSPRRRSTSGLTTDDRRRRRRTSDGRVLPTAQ